MQRKMRNKRTREEQREDWIEHKAGKRYKVVYTSRGIGPVPIPRQITRRTKFNPKLKSTLKRIFYNVYVTRGLNSSCVPCPNKKRKRNVESVVRVGEDGITFRVSRYLLHVLIEDEEAVRHAVERRRGGGTGSGTSGRRRRRARGPRAQAFQGPINEWAPRGPRNGPNQPNSNSWPSLRLVLCNARDARIN